jgi:Flp pilus assembly protein CpaB
MKGMPGLAIACFLGLLAAGLNWFYLDHKSREFQKVSFVSVAPDTQIHIGETFTASHFAEMPVPEVAARKLEAVAVLWKDLDTVVGMNAVREFSGEELLLRKDLETPPAELELAQDERAMWIPVDQKNFIASLVVPGDEVDFLLPSRGSGTAAPSVGTSSDGMPSPTLATHAGGHTEIVGPFKVLSVGNRLGKTNVLNASRVPQLQENIITVRVKMSGNTLDDHAQRLLDAMQATNYREVGLLLRPRKK